MQMANQMGFYGCTIHSQLQICLTGKKYKPPYREDPICMTEHFTSIFATHHPSWADIHTLMNMMFTGDERTVIDKAREEVYQLHLTYPNGTPEAHLAVPEPNWDPNEGGMLLLEHYHKCLLAGL